MKKIQLSVPKPCHENWNGMTPDDKGRFCASCQKTVIDFSTMSDRQLAQFFKKPTGSVCGRFHQDQLDREMEIPKKRIPWVKYFFTITLPAFLVSCKLSGRQALQGKVMATEQHITGDTAPLDPFVQGEVPPPPPPVTGKPIFSHVDSNAQLDSVVPLHKPKIATIERMKRCKVQAIKTDSIRFANLPFAYQPLQLQPKEIDHTFQPFTGILGRISVSRITVRKKQGTERSAALKQIPPTQSSLLLYPNPVNANAPLTVTTKGLQDGRYLISVFSSNGAAIQQEPVELSKESQSFQLLIKTAAQGVYFLRLQHEESGKSYSQKIMVN